MNTTQSLKMRPLELALVTLVATCLGTSMHFAHHLPFFGHLMGYIFPVNECVWEHMKMLFTPMLLTSLYMCARQRTWAPFGGMIASCLVCIPLQIFLFYAYWFFVGHSILVVDCIAYVVVMIFGFWLGNRWAAKDCIRKRPALYGAIAIAMIILIAVLTYHNPGWNLFTPEVEEAIEQHQH